MHPVLARVDVAALFLRCATSEQSRGKCPRWVWNRRLGAPLGRRRIRRYHPRLMNTPNPTVDAFVNRAKSWRDEIQKLRTLLLACGLDEDIKWGKPCFMFEGANVAIIQPFKEFCALMFFKGALIEDTHGLLRSQGEHTQSALRLEFTSAAQIKKGVLQSYVKQAIAVEKEGLKVEFKAKHELELPAELTAALEKNARLATAFQSLTPGRRRAYVMHITSAKQAQTRAARIEKCAPLILAGKGLNDR